MTTFAFFLGVILGAGAGVLARVSIEMRKHELTSSSPKEKAEIIMPNPVKEAFDAGKVKTIDDIL